MPKKPSISVRVSPKLKQTLRKAATVLGLSESDIVRMAVAEFLKSRGFYVMILIVVTTLRAALALAQPNPFVEMVDRISTNLLKPLAVVIGVVGGGYYGAKLATSDDPEVIARSKKGLAAVALGASVMYFAKEIIMLILPTT